MRARTGIELRDRVLAAWGVRVGDLLVVPVGVVVWREPDGIFLVSDRVGRPLASFYAESVGWWRIVRNNGTEVRVWRPGAGPEEITVRALR